MNEYISWKHLCIMNILPANKAAAVAIAVAYNSSSMWDTHFSQYC